MTMALQVALFGLAILALAAQPGAAAVSRSILEEQKKEDPKTLFGDHLSDAKENVCEAKGKGWTLCGHGAESCANTQSDAQNCGGCGVSCPATATCAKGVCLCPAGENLVPIAYDNGYLNQRCVRAQCAALDPAAGVRVDNATFDNNDVYFTFSLGVAPLAMASNVASRPVKVGDTSNSIQLCFNTVNGLAVADAGFVGTDGEGGLLDKFYNLGYNSTALTNVLKDIDTCEVTVTYPPGFPLACAQLVFSNGEYFNSWTTGAGLGDAGLGYAIVDPVIPNPYPDFPEFLTNSLPQRTKFALNLPPFSNFYWATLGGSARTILSSPDPSPLPMCASVDFRWTINPGATVDGPDGSRTTCGALLPSLIQTGDPGFSAELVCGKCSTFVPPPSVPHIEHADEHKP